MEELCLALSVVVERISLSLMTSEDFENTSFISVFHLFVAYSLTVVLLHLDVLIKLLSRLNAATQRTFAAVLRVNIGLSCLPFNLSRSNNLSPSPVLQDLASQRRHEAHSQKLYRIQDHSDSISNKPFRHALDMLPSLDECTDEVPTCS